MAKRMVYIAGRDADINGNISVIGGKIVKAMPNYFEVFEEMPKPDHTDIHVYGAIVDEEKIQEVQEGGRKLRLWEGPVNCRSNPQYRIMVELFSLQPHDGACAQDDGVDADMIKEREDLKNEIDILTEQVAKLQADTQPKSLRQALAPFSNEELEEMPYIASESVLHLREWIEEEG